MSRSSSVDISSRKNKEFMRRTTIFEGAFRAWSHLGGLEPHDIESRPVADLDPLDYPLVGDPRLSGHNKKGGGGTKNADGSAQRFYYCEPIPSNGLSHPYVQAILSPWLGNNVDRAKKLEGLASLRTWWQHRRPGPSRTFSIAFATDEKLRQVVDGYTRLFFLFGHCIVVHDKVQPPHSLHEKMKELEKQCPAAGPETCGNPQTLYSLEDVHADLSNPNLTPLHKLHIIQRRIQESTGSMVGASPIISDLKGKCVPGKLNLPRVVDAVRQVTAQIIPRGITGTAMLPGAATTSDTRVPPDYYGDPDTTPVVYTSHNGDIQIVMMVDGIICAHCVKIVETALRGISSNGLVNKSTIDGLLDAAADRDIISSVLIKIDHASNAKRIAFEAAISLGCVGYYAEAKTMRIGGGEGSPKQGQGPADRDAWSTAFAAVAQNDPHNLFDWTVPCTCPDYGVFRVDCQRHSQLNVFFLDAFDVRAQQVNEYCMAAAVGGNNVMMKLGVDCTGNGGSPMLIRTSEAAAAAPPMEMFPYCFGNSCRPVSLPHYLRTAEPTRRFDDESPPGQPIFDDDEPDTLASFLRAPNLEDFDHHGNDGPQPLEDDQKALSPHFQQEPTTNQVQDQQHHHSRHQQSGWNHHHGGNIWGSSMITTDGAFAEI
jgi:copper chaperone CopZ